MCTLTVLPVGAGWVITMNRDERRIRPEGEVHRAANLLYPVDAEAGGTWIGINEHQVMLALLNRYQNAHHEGAPTRGKIIPLALAEGPVDKVESYLKHLHYKDFNPFDLVLWHSGNARRYCWDGQQLTVIAIEHAAYCISSSGADTINILAHRQELFANFLVNYPEAKAGDVLQQFHLAQTASEESRSVLMDREKVHSKSLVQIAMLPKSSLMTYLPEAALKYWREEGKLNSSLAQTFMLGVSK